MPLSPIAAVAIMAPDAPWFYKRCNILLRLVVPPSPHGEYNDAASSLAHAQRRSGEARGSHYWKKAFTVPGDKGLGTGSITGTMRPRLKVRIFITGEKNR